MHIKYLEVSKYYCRQLTFFPQKFLISQRKFFIIYYSYFPQMPALLLLIKLPGMFYKKNKLCQFVPRRLSDFQPPYRVVYLKALLFNMICSLWLDCQKITTLVWVVTRLRHKWHDGENELEMELTKNPSSIHLIISAAIQLEPSILLCNEKIDICLFLIFKKMHCIEAPCIQT